MNSYATKLFLLVILGIGLHQNIKAQISGTIFRDFNANGLRTTTAPDPIESGLKDVTINAVDASGSTFTTTSDENGNYTINGGTGPYRVEFMLPSGYYASNGNGSSTTVQFVASNGTADLGVNYPGDYCHTTNPKVIIPSFVNGSATDPSVSQENTLGMFDYNTNTNATGSASSFPAKIADVGAVYGLAYGRSTKSFQGVHVFLKKTVKSI